MRLKIIPAMDIIDGKCVRLSQGDYDKQKVYSSQPLEVALRFEDAGITHLHVVDLDGAKSAHIVNWRILERIANKTSLKIDFGGGIKSEKDLHIAFNSGAQQVSVGSLAAKNKELFLDWLSTFGADKIILGADAKDRKIATHGWQHKTDMDVVAYITDYRRAGVQHTICTDVAKDGMLAGPSYDLYSDVRTSCPDINLIASGGIADMEDIYRLADMDCYGAIVGKAIYEDKITLKDIEKYHYAS